MEEYLRDLAEAKRAVEFIQEGWDLLQGPNFCGLDLMKAQVGSFHKNLGFISAFLRRMKGTSDDHEELQALVLVKQIRSVAAQLLDAANSYTSVILDRKIYLIPLIFNISYYKSRRKLFKCLLIMDNLVKQITLDITKDGMFTDHGFTARHVREVGNSSKYDLLEQRNSHTSLGEEMIGLNDETLALLDKIMGNQKQREVISITGMAGIGKTTLAQRLYNDQSVVYHFHVRGWVSVSQVYHENKLLSSILSCIPGQKDFLSSLNDEDLGVKLYKCLRGNRYLIVIDDIWDIGVWKDMEMYFPNDGNGSRILITTRIIDMASNASNSPPHCLRFLNPEESWHLFTSKVFSDKTCPHELVEIVKKIVARCKGLPIAIVLVAGLLLNKEQTQEIWSHVAQNIGPLIDSNSEQIMDILALSYEHLPEYLKTCFLHLAIFPEDYEIPVKKLIRLWIAEGYVNQTGDKRLEDLARDYLMELCSRSLVIVAMKRSIGGIKTCHIHDMVREFCIRKASDKNLIILPASKRAFRLGWLFNDHNENGGTSTSALTNTGIQFHINFLRELDLREITFDEFPTDILRLLHLKYLALQVEHIKSLPRRLYLLWNLETFILLIVKGGRLKVPYEIWKMEKLRHLDISRELEFELVPTVPGFEYFFFNHPSLPHLQTISYLCPSDSVEEIFARAPTLRKLGFHLTLSDDRGKFSFPDLSSLKLLESMKFEYQTLGMKSIDLPHLYEFPPRLKKLTLIGSHVNWEQMSILGMLPNLEVLKIIDNFFSGPRWETREDGFRCLRFLKLSHMNLEVWITSESHFPKLEQLVLNACLDLVGIPFVIGDICTLQVIKVYRSSSSAVDSAWEIQESQRDLGNDLLKVFIYPHLEEKISVLSA